MRRLIAKTLLCGLLLAVAPQTCLAIDWIFDNGPYTRNPKTGKRVDQYRKPAKANRIPYDEYQRWWDQAMGDVIELVRDDLREDLFGTR